ncbi:B-cell receptor-associated protein 29 isoform X3 [Pelodiscus sinensis]|uniref:B-cell receptor-associated protein 29 isoform X3 n=1 Tax=Pelodiscus sinensis TaxID=13735 RepID=UPI003F6B2CD8
MTFQWTAVATFLYTEIGVILLLCIPFISPLSVLRRTVTLITQLAKEMGIQVAMEIQVGNTNEAARKYMEENEKLQQMESLSQQCVLWALNEKGKCENEQALDKANKKLMQETEILKAELKKTSQALSKATNEVTAIKKESEGLKKEYDRLIKEHERLQKLLDEEEDWKDQ